MDEGGDLSRFGALARVAREPVFIHEAGIVLDVNQAFTRLLGWTRDEIVGKNGLEVLIAPESVPAVRASMANAQAGVTPELVMWTKDRRRLVVESASEPLDVPGRQLRIVALLDLTERRRAESSARDAARLLSSIVDATDQAIFVKSPEGRYLLQNRAWKEVFGARAADTDVFSPELLAAVRREDAAVLTGRAPATSERDLPTSHGIRRYLTTKFPLLDEQGQPVAIGGIGTDVTTQRRRADLFARIAQATMGFVGPSYFDALTRALAETFDADYALLGELLPGGMVRTRSAWAGTSHAPPLEYSLHGTPCEQVMVGTPCIYPDGAQALFPEDELLVDMGVRAYAGVPVRGADGQPRGILAVLYKRPLPADHDLADVLAVSLEVFAARAASELDRIAALSELEAARASLERAVATRTAELTAANEELESFAYSVSHDLRAPLRHIVGFSEMLERTLGEGLTGEPRRHLGVIRGAATRMSALVDDLLRFSRMGRATLQREPVRLEELTRAVVAERADVGVEWEIGPLPVVLADRALLRVVLVNLLDNAVKYSRPRSASSAPRVSVRAESGPATTGFSVRDNGVGFDMAFASQLFGVFQRLHHEADFEGTGIGLATVARIVHRHGGSVVADASPGAGACFTVLLPTEAS